MRNSYYRLVKVNWAKRSNSKLREVEIARTSVETRTFLDDLVELAVTTQKLLSQTEEYFIEKYEDGEYIDTYDWRDIERLAHGFCIGY